MTEAQRRYVNSEKAREARRRYRRTAKGRATDRRHGRTPRGRFCKNLRCAIARARRAGNGRDYVVLRLAMVLVNV